MCVKYRAFKLGTEMGTTTFFIVLLIQTVCHISQIDDTCCPLQDHDPVLQRESVRAPRVQLKIGVRRVERENMPKPIHSTRRKILLTSTAEGGERKDEQHRS